MTTGAARPARRSGATSALPRSFYDRPTELVARELLGAVLECRTTEGVTSGLIVETEAYLGEHDLACHAASGRTTRTAPLYGLPGIAYVYFIYGAHWCFNAVTRAEGEPSAVLVRALEPLDGLPLMRARRPSARRDVEITNGPGKLCQALGIAGRHNMLPLQSGSLIIRAGRRIPDEEVVVSPRIGISRAAEWPLRWFIRDNAFVSRTPSHFPRASLRP